MRRSTQATQVFLFALLCAAVSALSSAPSAASVPSADHLRHRGFAELENEKPELAEATYRELLALLPKEPLGHGNLAIALLRQQKYEDAMASVDTALGLAPKEPRLLAIRGEILQWSGDLEGGLTVLAEAADAAPEDLEILYATYHLATTLEDEASQPIAHRVLRRLVRLRPENLVVLLQLGRQAIADGDRSTASSVYLRIQELLWQVQPIAQRALDMVTTALESDDLSSARVPAQRLENVLKVSAMFRESRRELKTGIQGIPLDRFLDEPPVSEFGPPLAIQFTGKSLSAEPGLDLAAADFDGDQLPDLARLTASSLEIRLAAGQWAVASSLAIAHLDRLLATDLDNDGAIDLVAAGPKSAQVWLGDGAGGFTPAADMGLATAGARALAVIDFDIEGDLDLAMAGAASGPADLYRNNLEGALERVGTRSLPRLADGGSTDLAVSDLDRDGDLDLLVAHGRGLTWVDNLRQGRFVDRTTRSGLASDRALTAAIAADLDGDGLPDVVTAGRGVGGNSLAAWRNTSGRFEAWQPAGLASSAQLSDLITLDADNDGRLDLAMATQQGLQVLTQGVNGEFIERQITSGPANAARLVAADFDQDGDLDIASDGVAGLTLLHNEGGNKNHWLTLRLRGLDKGSSKNNLFGVGSVVEVRAGGAYQYHEAAGDFVHLGLGQQRQADVVRVVWTNGVPQNRIALAGDQRLVEEQLLKGSCPFLYAWDGERFAFVTDLLWGAPIGLPAAPGVWVASDESELVKIDSLVADRGEYRLRVTEELWEAAFFDKVRLWVVDHPADVEVASNLRIIPGQKTPEKVLASSDLRPVSAALDGKGRDVTARVRHRDEVYADGYQASRYQGVAKPWNFTFDLGTAPNGPVRLHLDGWIFPADASLNLAVAQRTDLPYLPPRLEVETAQGWQPLMDNMGFPPGKTKTMVIDVPALPEGAHRLRIVTSLWLHWDRIAWTTNPRDEVPQIRQKLLPSVAELRFRGYSKLVRQAPNAPHSFDYAQTTYQSPWLPFRGNYTKFGDVTPLLADADDKSVILAPGDEIDLRFDASKLAPVAEGWQRTLFLESHGWDKDADRNTFEAEQLEPLPFRAMKQYGDPFPDTPEMRRYRTEWLTRELGVAEPAHRTAESPAPAEAATVSKRD